MPKTLTTQELRDAFTAFFTAKGHTHYPSASLIPENDPTILFTVAGMAQFKDMFLGRGTHPFTRAVTCQKVIRTNDIMEVGRTPRHHTFFEMLGNFSFNDYFKHEAIVWAWEFLTKVLDLPEERLSVSVHEIDDEAYAIWTKQIGLPPERVFRLGDADNFWPANAPAEGPFGPGGCCSEIFWDFQNNDNPDDNLTTGSDRFVEVWNLVFPQFNVSEPRQDDGRYTLENLGRQNIDTGMGLERIACVIQGKTNNFDTDEFQVIIKQITELSGVSYVEDAKDLQQQTQNTLLRRVCDHVRAVSFCISDGAIPANVGRGYVVRRLIRRATLDVDKLGVHETVLYKVVSAVVAVMGAAYPDLLKRQDLIEQTLQAEEESFRKTLRKGLDMLQRCLQQHRKDAATVFSGDDAFELVTTHGFPRELIEELISVDNLQIDEAQFDKRWQAFVEISKSKTVDVFTSTALQEAKPRLGKTEFVGYDSLSAEVAITLLEVDGKEVSSVEAGTKLRFALDKTPFYAESGGQLGDQGVVVAPSFEISVTDTQKDEDLVIHIGVVKSGTVQLGPATAQVHPDLRSASQANHSATHLLHSALYKILGDHIAQQGSQVGPDGLRFDYNNPKAPSRADLQRVEDLVNAEISAAHAVKTQVLDLEAAQALGAKAQFGEKYGKSVRVVTMGNADVSLEFCGGCHVANTKEIQYFRLLKDEASSAGIRRIVAVSGRAALALREQEQQIADECASYLAVTELAVEELADLAKLFKVQNDGIAERIKNVVDEARDLAVSLGCELEFIGDVALDQCVALQKQIKTWRKLQEHAAAQAALAAVDDIIAGQKQVAGQALLVGVLPGVDAKALKQVADVIKQQVESYCLILAANNDGKALLAVAVSDDLQALGVKAGDLVGSLAKMLGGGGGGRPDYAQAGGKDGAGITAALAQAEDLFANALNVESAS